MWHLRNILSLLNNFMLSVIWVTIFHFRAVQIAILSTYLMYSWAFVCIEFHLITLSLRVMVITWRVSPRFKMGHKWIASFTMNNHDYIIAIQHTLDTPKYIFKCWSYPFFQITYPISVKAGRHLYDSNNDPIDSYVRIHISGKPPHQDW